MTVTLHTFDKVPQSRFCIFPTGPIKLVLSTLRLPGRQVLNDLVGRTAAQWKDWLAIDLLRLTSTALVSGQHYSTFYYCMQTYACAEINTLTRDAIASRRTAVAEAGQEIADLLRASHAALEVTRMSLSAVH